MSGRTVVAHRAEVFVVSVSSRAGRRKIFQVKFSDRDGSIFVSFPYFKNSRGLLSIVTSPAGAVGEHQIDMKHQGKCTSHLVKYSHHSNGRAHFSQDGKILTKIKRQSVPLTSVGGHLFTVYAWGLDGFQLADKPKDSAAPTLKRVNLNFDVDQTDAVRIAGRYYILNDVPGPSSGTFGPIINTTTIDGQAAAGFLVAHARDIQPMGILLLTCYKIRRDSAVTTHSVLQFLGGFDPWARDSTRETSFLMMLYPAENYDDLRHQLGSVDFRS